MRGCYYQLHRCFRGENSSRGSFGPLKEYQSATLADRAFQMIRTDLFNKA